VSGGPFFSPDFPPERFPPDRHPAGGPGLPDRDDRQSYSPDRRSRVWSVTGGRVHDVDFTDIRIDTHVTTLPGAGPPPPGSQYTHVLALCRTTLAVAQLASQLGAPVSVTAAVVATLRHHGLVETRSPLDMTGDTVVTHALLERVKKGLLDAI
jgi:hypothetical protein